MTESDGNAENDSARGPIDPEATVNAASELDPQSEAEVRDLLGSLPSVTMPEEVRARIAQALAAEPNPYAVEPASAPNVTSINSRAHRRNRWLVGAAGVAAVGVLGVVVGSTVWTETTAPPTSAAVVSMSQSGTVYQKAGLESQVKQALPTWKTSASESAEPAEPAASTSAATPTTSSGPIAATPATTKSAAEVATAVRDQISRCLQRVDSRQPMHVDIAKYRELPKGPNEPVAVAVVRGDGSIFDVYVLDMECVGSIEDIVREHLTVTEPTQ